MKRTGPGKIEERLIEKIDRRRSPKPYNEYKGRSIIRAIRRDHAGRMVITESKRSR